MAKKAAAQTRADRARQAKADRPRAGSGRELASSRGLTDPETVDNLEDDQIDDSVRIAPGPMIKVIATRVGYYGEKRRRVGDVFLLYPRWGMWGKKIMNKDYPTRQAIDDDTGERLFEEEHRVLTAAEQFSDKWMERVDGKTHVKLTSPNEAIRIEKENIQGANQAAHSVSTTGANTTRPTGVDVLGADD